MPIDSRRLQGLLLLTLPNTTFSTSHGRIDEKVRGGNDADPMQSGRQSPQLESGFAVFYVAPAHTEELTGEKERTFNFGIRPQGWVSVVDGDEELEYRIAGNKLRIRLDYGSKWSGEEMDANSLISGDAPFALTMRPAGLKQRYFPAVSNTSPSKSFFSQSNRSGWMVFEF